MTGIGAVLIKAFAFVAIIANFSKISMDVSMLMICVIDVVTTTVGLVVML